MAEKPNRKIVNAAFRLKPVAKDAEGKLHFIKPVDIYTRLDDAGVVKPLKEAWDGQRLGEATIEIPCGLRAIYGPTIAQVLNQLAPEVRRKAKGFTVGIKDGMYSGEDLSIPARVVFYGGRMPEEVKKQPVIAHGKKYAAPLLSEKQLQFIAAVQTAKPVAVMKPIAFRKPDAPGAAP
jgi:hypothetical protein